MLILPTIAQAPQFAMTPKSSAHLQKQKEIDMFKHENENGAENAEMKIVDRNREYVKVHTKTLSANGFFFSF